MEGEETIYRRIKLVSESLLVLDRKLKVYLTEYKGRLPTNVGKEEDLRSTSPFHIEIYDGQFKVKKGVFII